MLNGGFATYATSTLDVGFHAVSAEYVGDLNFTGTTNTLVPDQLVNTMPIGGNDIIERDFTNAAKVSVSTLLSNDHDMDGDPLSFLGVNANSATGGVVTVTGNWIFYAPFAGFTNADSFTYNIGDGRGLPVSVVVAVSIRTNNGPSPNLVINSLGNGSFRIRFDGIWGRTYRIQRSESLETPEWITVGSATADQFGVFEFVVSDLAGSTGAYYRSVYP